MLSAAAAVLLAQPMAVRADVTINSATTNPLATTASGNITIEAAGAISVENNGAALTLDSNNFINSSGQISNLNNSGSIGIMIDTSDHNVVAASPGLVSLNSITVTGEGSNKTGVLVTGGNTYFGNITISNTASINAGTPSATMLIEGASSSAFRQTFGTRVDGDISFGGSITGVVETADATQGGNTLFLFDGEVNGNIYFDGSLAASSNGQNARGIALLGGVHACANANTSASQLAAGYTCPSGNGKGQGAVINAGRIIAVGQLFVDPRSKDPILESGSVMIIGNSIDGGLYNAGPATAAGGINAAVLSGSGVNGNAVLRIDPLLAATTSGVRGPINIGPLSADIDVLDPGYSFLNRGTISAQPTATQLSSSAVFIQGASPTYYTCLGTGDFAGCAGGGILNTGTISAVATTDATTLVTSQVNATAFTLGPYAAVPRLDVEAQSTGIGSTTPGTISALVTGTSGGIANAVIIAQDSRLPTINVGPSASIVATVETSTLNPGIEIANSAAPFTMVAVAIVDSSSTLTTINNAGLIKGAVTAVTPGLDAVVVTTVRAIDLTNSTASGVTINNSGKLVGDVLFGAGGNNYTLNVGNTGGGGAANAATGSLNTPNNYAVVAAVITSEAAGSTPGTLANLIDFGAGSGHTLRIGGFGYVNSVIRSNPGAVAVTVENNGTLFIANTSATGSLNASTFDITGGTLGLTVTQNTTATTPVIRASQSASISPTSAVAMQFGSFISSGTTAASVNNPTAQEIVLISAPVINISSTTLAQNNLTLSENLPFLFQANTNPLRLGSAGGNQTLLLSLTPRSPGALNADGTPGLGLSGDALAQFPYVASALATDPGLGAAIATSLTVYNTPNTPSSGINIAASQQQAQQAFSQFGPDVSGGGKQVAIMLTDQATGPVAARQRLLRSYANVAGDLTLWGQEFFGNINNKGRVSADGSLTNYKDHGFGFTLGMDAGSPRDGWYGGAFTFYSGDITQSLPRNTKTQTQWYMLTGYSHWKGRRLFVDTQASFAYGDFVGRRDLAVGAAVRAAEGKRNALMLALGGKMGAGLRAGWLEVAPHISLDAMAMREEGYTESGGGPGFNLQVNPAYANSLRTALGVDFRSKFSLWGIQLSPEARVGYRYDLANAPMKLKAGFVSTGGTSTVGNTYNFVGPDPDTGNMFGGLTLGAGTDYWQVGVNFDLVRGNNGSTTQVGTLTLLGRI
jgi:hypothetical protein